MGGEENEQTHGHRPLVKDASLSLPHPSRLLHYLSPLLPRPPSPAQRLSPRSQVSRTTSTTPVCRATVSFCRSVIDPPWLTPVPNPAPSVSRGPATIRNIFTFPGDGSFSGRGGRPPQHHRPAGSRFV